MTELYNVEYRILDKVGRTKITKHIGVFKCLSEVEKAKEQILLEDKKNKIAFDVYVNEYATIFNVKGS